MLDKMTLPFITLHNLIFYTLHDAWRSTGYRGERQALELHRKVGGQMWEWTGNGQAFKTDKQKKKTIKGLLPLTPKPVNLKYASSSSFVFRISDTAIPI